MKLALLTGDILAQLLHYDDISHAVVTLWKCGDSTLNLKMSEWVTVVDLEDRNPVSTSRYPLMLSQLRKLRRLRICHQGHIAPPSILSVELRKLSSTLQELDLNSFDGHFPFYDFPATLDPSKSFLSSNVDFKLWNICASFPHLLKLIVTTTNEFFKYQGSLLQLSPGLCPLLPPHLEHLDLSTAIYTNPSRSLASCVPDSIHTLKLYTLVSSPSWPPNLTHLEGHMDGTDVEPRLPPTLTRMPSLKIASHLDSAAAVQHLTALKSLDIDYGDDAMPATLDWMPKTITEIQFCSLQLSIPALQALPATVKRLTIMSVNWSTAPPAMHGSGCEFLDSLWPKSLEALEGGDLFFGLDDYNSNSTGLDGKKVIASLPQSLTNLDMDFEEFEAEWDFTEVPQLQSLHLHGYRLPSKFFKSEA